MHVHAWYGTAETVSSTSFRYASQTVCRPPVYAMSPTCSNICDGSVEVDVWILHLA